MPKNNVVADHFKVRGRMPPGQDVAHEVEKQQYGQAEKAATPKGAGKGKRKTLAGRKSG